MPDDRPESAAASPAEPTQSEPTQAATSPAANSPAVASAPAPHDLPRPRLTVTPAKAGYPAKGGDLDLLVNLGVDLPSEQVDRKPIALALVLDRSGSMSGEPLEAAKSAACAAIEMLLPDDWVSVVTFESGVEVVARLGTAGVNRSALLRTVKSIQAGGSTALFAGWAEGLSQAMSCPITDAGARVVLLSDGGANVGISDASSIAADVVQATAHGVTTTTMGFGRHYDEHLLRAMADAGQGNYVFIEGAAQVAEAFQHELAGLSALRGRNVTLAPSAGVSLLSAVGGRLPSLGAGVRLPDIIAGLDRDLVLTATFSAGAKDPGLTLTWTDVLSGTEERLAVPLDISPLPSEKFAALPTDQSVTSQVSLARIANLKYELSQAFRSGQTAEAARLLGALEDAVAALPAGEERSTEQRELVRLRGLERSRDTATAARYAERNARDRTFGTSDLKRSKQFSMERDHYDIKMREFERARSAQAQGAQAPRVEAPRVEARGVAARVDLPGPDGPVTVRVVIDDITTQDVDVLINSTNRNLFGNAGVDGAVHRQGGPELTQATRQIGTLDYGQAAFTPGFRLPARYVVHAVAMPWQDGSSGEADVLERAYRSAFAMASQLGAGSLAVTALGTGTYGVPSIIAARSAFGALHEAVMRGAPFNDVRFVILDARVAKVFAAELPGLLALGSALSSPS